MKSPAVPTTAPAATACPSQSPPIRRAMTGRAPADHVQRRKHDDDPHDEEPALAGGHGRIPEPRILHEERGVDGHVHEAVDPAPPADLKGPERPERAPGPRDVPALVGQRGGEL